MEPKWIKRTLQSSETINAGHFDGLKKWSEITNGQVDHAKLVYAGNESFTRNEIRVESWRNL